MKKPTEREKKTIFLSCVPVYNILYFLFLLTCRMSNMLSSLECVGIHITYTLYDEGINKKTTAKKNS